MLMNNYYVIYESIQMRTMWRDIWFPGRTAGSQQYTTCRNSLKTWLWGESNFFYALRESIHKTTDERRSLHDWRGRDSGCPVAKTYYRFRFALPFITQKIGETGKMSGSGYLI